MDVKYAEQIRDELAPKLVGYLKKKNFRAASDELRNIDLLAEKIFAEIKSGKASREKLKQGEEFPQHIIDLMKLQIAQTSDTGLEHGFSVCGNEKIQVAEVGEKNHIGLKRCPGLTALFHTHPCNTPVPSEPDFESARSVDGLQHTCIGTEDGVRCYDPRTREPTITIPV